jgi:hypothetical protein
MHTAKRLGGARSQFEFYLRTGRRIEAEARLQPSFKFNPWHDPDDGRFTFRNGGRYYGPGGNDYSGSGGGGSGGGGASGSWEEPERRTRPAATPPVRREAKPPTATVRPQPTATVASSPAQAAVRARDSFRHVIRNRYDFKLDSFTARAR